MENLNNSYLKLLYTICSSIHYSDKIGIKKLQNSEYELQIKLWTAQDHKKLFH